MARGFLRFVSLTRLRREGCGGGWRHGLCRRVAKGRVLKMDGPWTRLRREGSEGSKGSEGKVLRIDGPFRAQGFLSLTGPLAPRVADCPSGNAYKVSVTDLLSVSYDMISTTVISHLRWLFPPFGGASHQRGMHFRRPQGGCMIFAAKGGIKNGAFGAVPRQRARSANQ